MTSDDKMQVVRKSILFRK